MASDPTEVGLGELTVRSGEGHLERLLAWAEWTVRTWAIENAGGLGYLLLAQQLVAPSVLQAVA